MLSVLASGTLITIGIVFLHWYSYRCLKKALLNRRRWDLNICCGMTDGGGINADIIRHGEVPNFVALDSIYRLWLFLTLRKVHTRLPPRIPLLFARKRQARVGQKIAA